jgi:hypothetical protein
MKCGYELTDLVAGEQHYADVKDRSVQEVLEFIFSGNGDGTFAHTIDQVGEIWMMASLNFVPLK